MHPLQFLCVGCIGTSKRTPRKGTRGHSTVLAKTSMWVKLLRIAQSDYDSVRWLRKAAAKGHPLAYYHLSYRHLKGEGCKRDLVEAIKFAKKMVEVDPRLMYEADHLMCNVACKYIFDEQFEESVTIVQPLAEKGFARAQCILAHASYCTGQNDFALEWATKSALQGHELSVAVAVRCCRAIEPLPWPQARFWWGVAREKEDGSRPNRAELVNWQHSFGASSTQEELQNVRDAAECEQPQTLQRMHDVLLLQRRLPKGSLGSIGGWSPHRMQGGHGADGEVEDLRRNRGLATAVRIVIEPVFFSSQITNVGA